MSEENETKTKKASKTRAPKALVLYHVHNIVRKHEGRLKRVKAARRPRLNLLLCGGLLRIPRNRYVPVTETALTKWLPELMRNEDEGMIKVTTPTGQRVDLSTLKVVEELSATPPAATPPDDSVKNDKTYTEGVGEAKPTVEGGKAPSEEVTRPAVLNPDVPEGRVEEEDTTGVDPAAAAGVDVTAASSDEYVTAVDPDDPSKGNAPIADLIKAVYDKYSAKALTATAKEMDVDTSGNKTAIATRLVEAGYRA